MQIHRAIIDQQRRLNTESLQSLGQNRMQASKSFQRAEAKHLQDDNDLDEDFLLYGSEFALRPTVQANRMLDQTVKNSSVTHTSNQEAEFYLTNKFSQPE